MSWGDKAVSPCVYTPGAGDAAGWALDAGLVVDDGRVGQILFAAKYVFSNALLDGSNKVYQWSDSSGNGAHMTQANAAKRPGVSDGRVLLTGAVYFELLKTAIPSVLNSGIFTIFMRGIYSGYSNYNSFVSSESLDYGTYPLVHNKGNSTTLACKNGNAANVAPATGVRDIMIFTIKNGVGIEAYNSTSGAVVADASASLSPFTSFLTIGNRPDTLLKANFEAEEIRIYSTILSAGEISGLRATL